MNTARAGTQVLTSSARGNAHASWRLCGLLGLLASAAALVPDSLSMLAYDRQQLLHGQWWRLFSAHLVHLNPWHLLMNLAGMVLLCEFLGWRLPIRHTQGVLVTSALSVVAGLWLTMPELQRYAGLSGVLHGVWAGSGLLLLWRAVGAPPAAGSESGARFWWALAMLVLAAKLLAESLGGPHPAAGLIGGIVVTQSHAWGAFGGVLYALAVCVTRRIRNAIGVHHGDGNAGL